MHILAPMTHDHQDSLVSISDKLQRNVQRKSRSEAKLCCEHNVFFLVVKLFKSFKTYWARLLGYGHICCAGGFCRDPLRINIWPDAGAV